MPARRDIQETLRRGLADLLARPTVAGLETLVYLASHCDKSAVEQLQQALDAHLKELGVYRRATPRGEAALVETAKPSRAGEAEVKLGAMAVQEIARLALNQALISLRLFEVFLSAHPTLRDTLEGPLTEFWDYVRKVAGRWSELGIIIE